MSRGSVARWLNWLRSPLLVPAIAVPFAAGALTYFAGSHPAENVNLSARHISGVKVATSASATISVYANQLLLGGATGKVEMVLPAPVSECEQLANQVRATCSGSGITVDTALVATWTVPQEFVLTSVLGDQIEMKTRTAASGGGMQVIVIGSQVPRVCLRQDPGPARLSLQAGGAIAPLPATTVEVPICTGLVVTVTSANPQGPSGITLQGISSARAVLAGKQMTVSAESMTLTLLPTSRDATYNSPVEIDSDRSFGMTVQLVAPDFASENGVQAHATSALEAHAERIDNALDRYRALSLIETGATTLVGLIVGLAIWTLTRRAMKRPPERPHSGAA